MISVSVRVHPGARRELVRLTGANALEIWLREPAREGRANAGIERVLSEALGVRRSAVRIARGASAREKIVIIDGIDALPLGTLGHDGSD